MKKRSTWLAGSLAIVVLCTAAAQASVQQEWAARYDALGPDTQGAARQVLVDATGSARIIGDYAGLFVARYDAGGSMLWSLSLPGRGVGPAYPWGGPTRSAVMDQGNVLYVPDTAGRLLQISPDGVILADVDLSALFDTAFATVGAGLHPAGGLLVAGNVTGSTTQGDVLVARLDASLQPVWIQVLDRSGGADAAAAFRVGPQGEVYLAGSTDNALSIWTIDAAGNPRLDLSGPLMTVSGFDVDASGGFAVDGGDLMWDAVSQSWYSTGLLLTRRYDASGQLLWSVTEEPGRYPGPVRIAEDGSVYVGAAANLNGTMPGYNLMKYGAGGQLEWERRYQPYGDSFIYDLALDRGEPIITGEYGYCYGQIATMKHSAAGVLLWSAFYTPPQSGCGSVNYGYSLALDAQHNLYVAGFTYDALNSIGHYPYKPTLLKYAQFDTTPPVTTATTYGTAGANGWTVSPITVALEAVDPEGSGVKELHWSIDGGAETVSAGASGSVAMSADGAHSISYYAVDQDDNIETPQVAFLLIDQTAPVTTAAISGTPGNNGWYRAASATISAADATSGVASVQYTVGAAPTVIAAASASVSLPEGTSTVTYTATDVAGNLAALKQTAAVRVDGTAPVVAVAVSPTTLRANNKKQSVRVTGTATDATSGVASTVVRVTDSGGRLVATTTFGLKVSLVGRVGEVYTFTATSTDWAGNSGLAIATVTVR